ncbi:hypothetical protein P152DRAFT_455453 [Eremomyces bilateralis CBS 781.70]|uniref:TFIIIC transcription initiation factor complex subunits Tfc3 n=1 Tax=Eremomyces bilateralis CBS 781.70 TaxID=1392243 RepID=A0A6G1GCK5_9PEZI|nr:uncharacterized protein P152DRAFT_455453 [Eremomyces bilateralis CBS 781.70]KAF1815732.1 hypothetical protein P152DRAFT_455453 [Eremomyces bilateralis CBS 781.70]
MAGGFDDLIEFLLQEIALLGEKGLSPSEFRGLIDRFYKPVGRNFGAAEAPEPPVALVDDLLVEQVWKWTTAHRDIWVGIKGEYNGVSWKEAVEIEAAASPFNQQLERAADVPQSQVNHTDKPDGGTPNPIAESQSNGNVGKSTETDPQVKIEEAAENPASQDKIRIYASEERIWHALAGHGIDRKRVPPLEFQLLCVIAAQGPKGIIQPQLVKLSGQDKRSLPRRTDALQEKGYIVKKSIIQGGMRTSILTLRRYVEEHTEVASDDAANKTRIFVDGQVQVFNAVDAIYELLKDIKVMPTEDLVRLVGFDARSFRRRMMRDIFQRLAMLGVIAQVKVKVSYTKTWNVWKRAVRLLRAPNEKDRKTFASLSKAEMNSWIRQQNKGTNGDGNAESDQDSEDEGTVVTNTEQGTPEIPGRAGVSDQPPKPTIGPQWDPDRLWPNIIYEYVDRAGEEGVSSMDLRARTFGPVWKRPFDIAMARLTDAWEVSQPETLRHLKIVRDTAVKDRTNHYLYRTVGHYQSLVNQGNGDWDIVSNGHLAKPGKKQKVKLEYFLAPPDEWGFPSVNTSLLAPGDGIAPLPKQPIGREAISKQKQQKRKYLGLDLSEISKEIHQEETQANQSTTTTAAKGKKRAMDRSAPGDTTSTPAAKKAKLAPMGKIAQEKAKKAREEAKRYVAALRKQAEKLAAWQITMEKKRRAKEAGLDSDDVGVDLREIKRATVQKVLKPQKKSSIVPPRRRGRPRKQTEKVAMVGHDEEDGDEHPAVNGSAGAPTTIQHEQVESLAPPATQLDHAQDNLQNGEQSISAEADNNNQSQALDEDKKALEQRTEEILTGFLHRTRRGVYIKPPFADRSFTRGRPRKTFMIAIKLDQLKEEVPEDEQGAQAEARRSELGEQADDGDDGRPDLEMVDANDQRVEEQNLVDGEVGEQTAFVDTYGAPTQTAAVPVSPGEELAARATRDTHPIDIDEQEDTDHEAETKDDIVMDEDIQQPFESPSSRKQTISKPSFKLWSLSSQNKKITKKRGSHRRPGVQLGGGTTALNRVKIILDLVNKCDGIIPGARAVYPSFDFAWKALHPSSGRIDSRTIERALTSMVEMGKLIHIEVPCERNGSKFTQSMYTFPEIDPSSDRVEDMKRNIRSCYPSSYHPPQLGIAPPPAKRGPPRHTDLYPKDETVQFAQPLPQPANVRRKQAAAEISRIKAAERAAKQAAREHARRERQELRLARQHLRETNRAHFRSIRDVTSHRAKRQNRPPMPYGPWGHPSLGFAPSYMPRSGMQTMYPSRYPVQMDPRTSLVLVIKGLSMLTQCSSDFHPLTGTFSTVTNVPRRLEQAVPARVTLLYMLQSFQMKAYYLMLHPAPTLHQQTGTFGTSAIVPQVMQVPRYPTTGGSVSRQLPALLPAPPSMYNPKISQLAPFNKDDPRAYDALLQSHARKVAKQPSFIKVDLEKALSESAKYFVTAITVVQALVGGVDQGINWTLVTTICKGNPRFDIDMDIGHLRYRWVIYRESFKDWLNEVIEDFREVFLEAYGKGEVDPIDFDKPYDYDWLGLVKWAMKKLLILSRSPAEFRRNPITHRSLPATWEALENSFSIESEPSQSRTLPEKFYNDKTNGTHRAVWVHNVPFETDAFAKTKPRGKKGKTQETEDGLRQGEKRMTKSYVRSVIATPDDQYDAFLARDILSRFPPYAMDRAIGELSRKNIISKRFPGPHVPPGRTWQLSDQLNSMLDRQITGEMYQEAAQFKADLDRAFSEGDEPVVRVPFTAKNGTMLAILNLVANGRCRLTPALPRIINEDQPLLRGGRDVDAELVYSKWGWLNGAYNTRIMNRKYLEFHVDVHPTARYQPGNPFLASLPEGTLPAPPTANDDFAESDEAYRGCYPLWLDHQSHIIQDLWERVVMAVVQIISFRAGVDVDGLSRAFKGMLEPWELEICVGWLEKVGAVERVAGKENYTVTEWWWMVPAAWIREETTEVDTRRIEEDHSPILVE